MCKLDLTDAYFSVRLEKDSRKLIRFRWEGNLYEFLCLCFGFGPATRIFIKLLKFPSILRRLNTRVINHLYKILFLGVTIQDLMTAKFTLIFLLRHLGFIINLKKSVLTTTQKIEFLGLEIDQVKFTLSLTPQKLAKSQSFLQRNAKGTSSISFETDKIDRTSILNSTVRAFGKNIINLSPTSSSSSSESGALISAADGIECLM